MTAAQHTSLFRFTFPDQSLSPLILLDLTDLSNSRQDNASISVDAMTGRMTGNGRFLPSFGQGNYVAYFWLTSTARASETMAFMSIAEATLRSKIWRFRVGSTAIRSLAERSTASSPHRRLLCVLVSASVAVIKPVVLPKLRYQISTSKPLALWQLLLGGQNSVRSLCQPLALTPR